VAGGAEDEAPVITLDTSAAGFFTETITLHGTGYNEDNFSESLNDTVLTVRGLVTAPPPLNQAEASQIDSVNLGNFRVGTQASAALSVSNIADTPAESLDGSVSSFSGDASATGSFTGLAAGQTDNSSIIVSLDSSSAGDKDGEVDLAFASRNGNSTTPLDPQE